MEYGNYAIACYFLTVLMIFVMTLTIVMINYLKDYYFLQIFAYISYIVSYFGIIISFGLGFIFSLQWSFTAHSFIHK